jgi:hypothetical protein
LARPIHGSNRAKARQSYRAARVTEMRVFVVYPA